MISRRNLFAKGLAGLGGVVGSQLLGRTSVGAPLRSKNLVIALAYGGWDPLWVFDPKPDSGEVDLVPGDVRSFGKLPIWTHPDRPNVTAFFEQWASRAAVINGVAVESLAHESCVDVVLTGALGEHRPDIGARVAQHLGSERALPYLALSAQAETPGLDALVGSLGDSNQIMALTTPDFAWPAGNALLPDQGLDLKTKELDAVRAYLQSVTKGETKRANTSARSAAMMDDYTQSFRRMEQLRAAARAGGMLAQYDLFEDVESPWRHVAAALDEGLSQVALVQPNLYWDTHYQNSGQGDSYEQFFGGLSLLMEQLDTRGIVDDTIVVVLSEMGRTPLHNLDAGKDHWPWTSAMILGENVAGGRAFGSTDEWLQPSLVNLKSGEPVTEGKSTGELLHAEHILAAVASLMGIETSSWFKREPFHALLG